MVRTNLPLELEFDETLQCIRAQMLSPDIAISVDELKLDRSCQIWPLCLVKYRAQTVVRRRTKVRCNWEGSLETLLAKVKLDLGSWHRPMIKAQLL